MQITPILTFPRRGGRDLSPDCIGIRKGVLVHASKTSRDNTSIARALKMEQPYPMTLPFFAF